MRLTLPLNSLIEAFIDTKESCFDLTCEYNLQTWPNTKVLNIVKDHANGTQKSDTLCPRLLVLWIDDYAKDSGPRAV